MSQRLVRFQLEEMELGVETLRLENQKLRAEIAEMTGDDMRAAPSSTRNQSVSNDNGEQSDGTTNSPVPTGSARAAQKRGSAEYVNTGSRSAAAAAKELNLPARRAEMKEEISALTNLLQSRLRELESIEVQLKWFIILCV